jgi:chloramphenicol 3-O-phosphotransferase
MAVSNEPEDASKALGGRRHGIFINGIQSAGKSSVAREIRSRSSTFRVLMGDDIVREFPEDQRVKLWREIFERLLTRIEAWLESSNVVVDAALTAAQIQEARRRFAGKGLFVLLRIDEAERHKRESLRRDRRLLYWDPSWHSMPGPDDLYHLVIDSGATSPEETAEIILAKAMERWPSLTV